jgi:hypothetical protein
MYITRQYQFLPQGSGRCVGEIKHNTHELLAINIMIVIKLKISLAFVPPKILVLFVN